MDPTLEALLSSWSFDPWILVPLLLTTVIYVRGWRVLQRRGSPHFHSRQLVSFLAGLVAVLVALASPLDAYGGFLLQLHMLQHLLLMMVAPPLLWLGNPLLPLLRGLPAALRNAWVLPLFRSSLRAVFGFLTRPIVAWLLFVGSSLLWHLPALYELTLRSTSWHHVEHFLFLGSAMLFWWVVLQPYPSPRRSRWLLVPYLLAADVGNTILAAILSLSDRVLYPHYGAVPRLWGIEPLDDQATAGVLMWIPGSIAFLVPALWIGGRGLFHGTAPAAPRSRRISLELVTTPVGRARPRDLLDLPLIGPLLHWRHARLALQLPLLSLALLLIYDGLSGTQITSLNLAGVLPWIHWRGLLVFALLVCGNVFCTACPFLVPRTLARRWLPRGCAWPRMLRGKWLAAGLLLLFFWSYEVFALWSDPWWTAWLITGYFGAAFAVDAVFRDAAFCKYVCPIGQFNFVQSLLSPVEIAARDPAICQRCVTRDCIRGRDGIPGCELHLFQPRKVGNLDCTWCLDCIHACPHDNIGFRGQLPGSDLLHDPQRSGLGRFSRRPDLAALVLLLVFGAYANAAAMVAPVLEGQQAIADWLGWERPVLVTTLGLVCFYLVLPALAVTLASWLCQILSRESLSLGRIITRYAYTLVPLGAAMWLSHYSFHFFTSASAFLPAFQRFAVEHGYHLGSAPLPCDCCAPVADWLLRLEIIFLDLGLLLSLYVGYRTAPSIRAFLPWAGLMLLLFIVGIWILFQPMEMRGLLDLPR